MKKLFLALFCLVAINVPAELQFAGISFCGKSWAEITTQADAKFGEPLSTYIKENNYNRKYKINFLGCPECTLTITKSSYSGLGLTVNRIFSNITEGQEFQSIIVKKYTEKYGESRVVENTEYSRKDYFFLNDAIHLCFINRTTSIEMYVWYKFDGVPISENEI